MHIAELLDSAAKKWPNNEAVVCGLETFTYYKLQARVLRLANALMSSGLNPGERVAIIHQNCHAFLEAYFATTNAGLVITPINSRLSSNELSFILQDSGAKILIVNHEYESTLSETISKAKLPNLKRIIWTGVNNDELPQIQNTLSLEYEECLKNSNKSPLPRSTGESEIAQLYYTSGTTGKPKGVILTHDNVLTHAQGTITEFGLNENDIWGHIAPMYHLADAWATFAITLVGGKHVMLPRFDPAQVLATIKIEGITISNIIPTMLNQMVNVPGAEDEKYPSLRYIMSGGAPIAPELVRKIMATFGCDYIQTYGMTETSPYLTVSLLKEHLKSLPEDEQFRYKSRTGRPFVTIDLKVVKENGAEVRPDNKEVGEIWVRGPTITPGYWHRPEETAAAFQDGWLKTGDLAVIDNEGYVNIVDRKKDIIVTGGENVYSTEVEHALHEHPGVLEAAVIGVPDEKWGEAVKAVVVLKPGTVVTGEELVEFCKERLTHYKAPWSVDFVDELPKTGTGKIAKRVLKEKYWVGHDKLVH